MSTVRRVLTEAEKANALLDWFIAQLGPAFAVERPADAARWSETRTWRYYVRRHHERSVVWVSSEFLKWRAVSEFSSYLLADSPTVVDLIRAGTPYVAVGGTGSARDVSRSMRGW